MKTELDALKDFLVNPFNELVDELDKNPVYNKCYIATGVTGQGKTFAVTSNHIEKLLIDKDQQIVIYSVPLSLKKDKLFISLINFSYAIVIFFKISPIETLKFTSFANKTLAPTIFE